MGAAKILPTGEYSRTTTLPPAKKPPLLVYQLVAGLLSTRMENFFVFVRISLGGSFWLERVSARSWPG